MAVWYAALWPVKAVAISHPATTTRVSALTVTAT
jgi:hypothetical protein